MRWLFGTPNVRYPVIDLDDRYVQAARTMAVLVLLDTERMFLYMQDGNIAWYIREDVLLDGFIDLAPQAASVRHIQEVL